MESAVSEQDLVDIEASLAGDEDAYARLVRRYQNRVAPLMWRFTRDRTVLEELVSDVFVKAYFSLGGYQGRAPFERWLTAIAVRVGYGYWKKQGRERRNRNAFEEMRVLDESGARASEAAEYLHELLERLPAGERLALCLYYFEGLNTEEMSERTGWSRSLVKVRLYRARKRLRRMFADQGFDGGESDE